MDLRISRAFLNCLNSNTGLLKTKPMSKAVQAAISIVEETRIADVNDSGLSILNMIFLPMPSCYYITA